MKLPPFRLGKLGAFLVGLLAAGLIYIGGSAVYDLIAIRYPPVSSVSRGIEPHRPAKLKEFVVTAFDFSPKSQLSGEKMRATLRLVGNSPFYLPADPQAFASSLGDSPADFAATVEQRRSLPTESAPRLPASLPRGPFFAVAGPKDKEVAETVTFRPVKVPRGWALIHCWRIWSGVRDWSFSDVQWSEPPTEFLALRKRGDLPPNSIVLGERSGDAIIRSYVKERQQFVKAVGDQVWKGIDHAVETAVLREVSRDLNPKSAFKISSVAIVRPKAAPLDLSQPLKYEATVQIEQLQELFREGDVATIRAENAELFRSLEEAAQLASEFGLAVGETPVPAKALFTSVSPAKSTWDGKISCEVSGTRENPRVEQVKWVDVPKWPNPPLFTAADAKEGTLFRSQDAALRTPEVAVAEIKAYAAKVQQAKALREQRWGSDKEAWRLAKRILEACGGREVIIAATSYTEEVSGRRVLADGKQFDFKGTRRAQAPLRMREDLTFTRERTTINQSESLDSAGAWTAVGGAIYPENFVSPEVAMGMRVQNLAREVVWLLAADQGFAYKLRVAGKPDGRSLVMESADLPEFTVLTDPTTGYVTSISYSLKKSDTAVPYEVRLSEYRKFGEIPRPTKVTLLGQGGSMTTEYTVHHFSPSPAFGREVFRHPLSSGRAFQGKESGPGHAVRFINGNTVGTHVLICIDDDPDTVGLAPHASRTVQLKPGTHEIKVTSWSLQLALRQSYRTDTKSQRILVDRNREITIVSDRSAIQLNVR